MCLGDGTKLAQGQGDFFELGALGGALDLMQTCFGGSVDFTHLTSSSLDISSFFNCDDPE